MADNHHITIIDGLHSAVGNHVEVILTNGDSVNGFLYTVDPVIGSLVLLDCEYVCPRPILVMAHAIRDIKPNMDRYLGSKTMQVLLGLSPSPCNDREWVTARRQAFIAHLQKYRIPYQCDGDDAARADHDPVIHVLGRARVEPPYVVTSVVCENAVIRNRVRDLVMKFG
ncbi:hypothetical protein BX666DRAFT_1898879 [Dichotomocladium elegans]|nr:hypothetical protein BX666DRAFT_1898879 [Dichotomocladium elegans]